MNSPNHKWKNRLKNTAIVLISIAFSVLLCESLVRWFAPQQLVMVDKDLWIPDNKLGWKHAPNINKKVNTGEHEVTFRTDKEGYRLCRHSKKGKYKILVIGDSFLEGLSIDEDSLSSCNILEAQRNRWFEIVNHPEEIVNTACSGYSPNQYYLKAREELSKNKYEYALLFFFVGNDFLEKHDTVFKAGSPNGNHSKFSFPKHFSLAAIKDAWLYPINESLEQYSQLYILFRRSVSVLLAKCGLTPYYFPKALLKSSENSPMWENTFKIVMKTDSLFRTYNTPYSLILIPHILQVHDDELEKYTKIFSIQKKDYDIYLPSKKFVTKCRENNIFITDPLDKMRKVAKTKRLYGRIDQHLNNSGHKELARIYREQFESIN
ncbi:MAG: hypothetical protein NTX03_10305 [Bacteroidetes bacterium]|nr:hypothetical protein [Bacteroidota bacterium]